MDSDSSHKRHIMVKLITNHLGLSGYMVSIVITVQQVIKSAGGGGLVVKEASMPA